jgi:hypothetical protein
MMLTSLSCRPPATRLSRTLAGGSLSAFASARARSPSSCPLRAPRLEHSNIFFATDGASVGCKLVEKRARSSSRRYSGTLNSGSHRRPNSGFRAIQKTSTGSVQGSSGKSPVTVRRRTAIAKENGDVFAQRLVRRHMVQLTGNPQKPQPDFRCILVSSTSLHAPARRRRNQRGPSPGWAPRPGRPAIGAEQVPPSPRDRR